MLKLRKLSSLRNFLGIPIWLYIEREKFKAVQARGNENFQLNIPAVSRKAKKYVGEPLTV